MHSFSREFHENEHVSTADLGGVGLWEIVPSDFRLLGSICMHYFVVRIGEKFPLYTASAVDCHSSL